MNRLIFCCFLLVNCLHAQRDPTRLTDGPMLGDVTANSVRIWGRTSDPSEFFVRYGTDKTSMIQISEGVMTSISHDNTGSIILNGLRPDTRYHYQLWVNERPHGESGTFKTLPDSGSLIDPEHNPEGLFNFKFQIGSCANQNPLHGIGHQTPTYETLNRDWSHRVDFHIMNGDWLYEELRDYPLEAWRLVQDVALNAVPDPLQWMPTVIGVWENYKLYLRRNHDLSDWHRNVPSYFTFDDHELVNDIWGTGTAGKRHRRTVFRDIGTYAWYDYLGWANPTAHDAELHVGRGSMKAGSDLLTDSTVDFTQMPLNEMLNLHVHWDTPEAGVNDMKYDNDDGHPNAYVYDIVEVVDAHTIRLHMPAKTTDVVTYSVGRRSYGKFQVANCEFYLIDTRSARDMHDVTERDRPGLSMLGAAQKRWLIDSMQQSDASFFFFISSVPFMIPHSGAGGFESDAANKEEAWTGFFDEREQLIEFWKGLNKPVFVMTGDLHNSFAVKITDKIWEFCCGPHNSVNHVPALDESNRPATGPFKFGPRACDIRWSSYILPDLPRLERLYPHFCIVQVNNVFNMPQKIGDTRWVAYPHPQIIFQYYDGRTGELAYAESISPRP
ncbi:MAG TPA: alkaline phosphatase [Verrucomicrobiales bacterium]|nr:alkaline phosphatase [Pedosphaera sp.]MBL6842809.1 alkaline phosphatase D family protein [Verrucomicrobiae bacterium]RZO71363.1 MAG: alkaline phosphatase [Limisphaerales bacterium]HAO65375.1 alkaline phosphatase [Verrucomicrobiales bacterium]HAW01135.1 alkaline phosphatase [Verrucomicrobiales bacterium]|tara:strand:+ start:1299 stop:3125 length:1827 start_codon:yes stop_codon:yes gene_type:complete